MQTPESELIRARYARRSSLPSTRYSRLDPVNLAAVHELEQRLAAVLSKHVGNDLSSVHFFEIGCGSGNNLLTLIQMGACPGNLKGLDLLADRIASAAQRLPESVELINEDALAYDPGAECTDIILLFTVFSSILDPDVRARLASRLWSWLRPGGSVLWYDFVVNNPRNRDVRGVPVKEVRALFPAARTIEARRVTLAPPLARMLGKIGLGARSYQLLNTFPFLRTHRLIWIEKP